MATRGFDVPAPQEPDKRGIGACTKFSAAWFVCRTNEYLSPRASRRGNTSSTDHRRGGLRARLGLTRGVRQRDEGKLARFVVHGLFGGLHDDRGDSGFVSTEVAGIHGMGAARYLDS